MRKSHKHSSNKRSALLQSKTALILTVLVVAAGAVLAFALLRGGEGRGALYTPVDSIEDIHGLAVDPKDPRILYVATHHGLIRGIDDSSWALVGNYRADFMGFTMHPNGKIFYASGHKVPDAPLMGVVRSDDGGQNWKIIALRGQVDFHAMTISPANPQILYGWYYRDGRLYKSLDGGFRWQNPKAEGLSEVSALVADAIDENVLWTATARGLYVSRDGGESFQLAAFGNAAVVTVAVEPSAARVLYAWVVRRVDHESHDILDQGLVKSVDGGKSWRPIGKGLEDVRGKDAVGYLAIDPSNPEQIYVATYSAAIYKSLDGGESWRLIYGK